MKKIYFLVPAILLTIVSSSQSWQWGKRGGALDTMYDSNWPEQVRSLATDAQGNVFLLAPVGVTGLDIDGNPKMGYSNTSAGATSDYMVASFTCDGTYRWSKVIGGWNTDDFQRIQLDAEGNVYIAGRCEPSVNTQTAVHFDSDLTIPVSGQSVNTYKQGIFILKYSNEGVLQWVRMPQRPDIPYLESYQQGGSIDLQTDTEGNSYWLVYANAASYAGGAYVAAQTGYHLFKYDAQGNFLNGKWLNLTYSGQLRNLKMVRNPASQTLYFIGHTTASLGEAASFGGQAASGSFLAAYDGQGTFLWLKQSSGTVNFNTGFKDISLDDNGDMYICGGTKSGMNFGGHTFTYPDLTTFPFILKLNSAGEVLWGTNPSFVSALTYGYAITKGAMTGSAASISWGASSIVNVPNSGYDVYMTRFDPETGAIIALESIPDDIGYADAGTAITRDLLGNFYVGGQLGHYMYVNNSTLLNEAPQSSDFFIAKFGSDDCTLGIKGNTKTGLNVYPNPAHDRLTVTGQSDKEYAIFNALGQRVMRGVVDGNEGIDVSRLGVGMYLLRVGDGNGETVKFIKR